MKLIAEEITKDNYPDFDEVVLLIQKKEDVTVVSSGFLKAITNNGFEWVRADFINPFNSFFGGFTKTTSFKPTHFAKFKIMFK